MYVPLCPECKVKLLLFGEPSYTFECPNEFCGLEFGLENQEEMSQILWKKIEG